MHESAAFYEETLYPLQNGVLRTLADCGAPFYLTGGTALHRHYFRDRYSDDLDFFVTRDDRFRDYVDRALGALRKQGYELEPGAFVRSELYARGVIRTAEASLKLDFIHDTVPRFGNLVSGDLFPRIDALRNILSNKVTALYRLEAKDFADLRTIARHLDFRWGEIYREASEKLAGIEAIEGSDLMRSFPPRLFESIVWRKRPDPRLFLADLALMAADVLAGKRNSLYEREETVAARPEASG